MTLLETLIAMTLLALLLTFVFGFFRELSAIAQLSEQAQKQSFQMRYLESRLGFVFERIVNENAKDRTFYFYTQPPQENISRFPSLILTFNNEVRQDPAFSGDVVGRLYVDLRQRLCLAIWPLHVPEPHRYLHEEVLCDRVVNFKCLFYAAPERSSEASRENADKAKPRGNCWCEGEWALGFDQMPSIIKLEIEIAKDPKDAGGKGESNEYLFSFVLPSSQHPVHYDE